MTVAEFPTTIAAITPAWLTAVLRQGGHLEDGAVRAVVAVPLGAGGGFLARLARLRLTYDRAGAADPPTLIAKVSTDNPDNRRIADAARAYRHEVGFYRELAARTPLRAPRCYAAELDRPSGDFLLLLEDLGAARTVDPIAGCMPADAETAVVALGNLHAAWWDEPRLPGLTWLHAADDPRVVRGIAAFFREAWPRFLERYGESSPASALAIGTALTERMADVVARVGGRPQTVCHGDFRLDNLFFDLPDSPIAVVDWQFCRRAGGVLDMADFITHNLEVAVRRAHEPRLLRRYHQALRDGGVTDCGFDRLCDEYRWALLYLYNRAVGASVAADPGNARGEALFGSFRERCFAANLDWDTGVLLKES